MNDYWNNPPEHPDLPECCDEYMTCDSDGNCICEICGKVIMHHQDIEPIDDDETFCQDCQDLAEFEHHETRQQGPLQFPTPGAAFP